MEDLVEVRLIQPVKSCRVVVGGTSGSRERRKEWGGGGRPQVGKGGEGRGGGQKRHKTQHEHGGLSASTKQQLTSSTRQRGYNERQWSDRCVQIRGPPVLGWGTLQLGVKHRRPRTPLAFSQRAQNNLWRVLCCTGLGLTGCVPPTVSTLSRSLNTARSGVGRGCRGRRQRDAVKVSKGKKPQGVQPWKNTSLKNEIENSIQTEWEPPEAKRGGVGGGWLRYVAKGSWWQMCSGRRGGGKGGGIRHWAAVGLHGLRSPLVCSTSNCRLKNGPEGSRGLRGHSSCVPKGPFMDRQTDTQEHSVSRAGMGLSTIRGSPAWDAALLH